MENKEREVLRVEQAAEFLGLAVSTLAKMRLRGDGPRFIKAGPRRILYRRVDLRVWLEDRVVHSTSETQPELQG